MTVMLKVYNAVVLTFLFSFWFNFHVLMLDSQSIFSFYVCLLVSIFQYVYLFLLEYTKRMYYFYVCLLLNSYSDDAM